MQQVGVNQNHRRALNSTTSEIGLVVKQTASSNTDSAEKSDMKA